jgi:hypothetical protein
MRSRFLRLVSTIFLVVSAVGACSAPEPRRQSPVCPEGEEDCAAAPRQKSRTEPSGSELGLPEPARAEDQEEPPPEASNGSVDEDGGTRLRDGGDAGPPSSTPTLDASNACWSGTLGAWVEPNGCYQRRSDGMWFQCGFDVPSQSNLWFRNVVNGAGRFGPCSSLHPLK